MLWSSNVTCESPFIGTVLYVDVTRPGDCIGYTLAFKLFLLNWESLDPGALYWFLGPKTRGCLQPRLQPKFRVLDPLVLVLQLFTATYLLSCGHQMSTMLAVRFLSALGLAESHATDVEGQRWMNRQSLNGMLWPLP